MAQPATSNGRLLVVGDLERLGPVIRDCYAPQTIVGVHHYLEGIAEVGRAPTQAVIAGIDPACREMESALLALKEAAGRIPVVLCCEPAFEPLGRRLVARGLDEYVVLPVDAQDLERALQLPTRRTRRAWAAPRDGVPTPRPEEIARLSELLPRLMDGRFEVMNELAALVACATRAQSATVVIDDRLGQTGQSHPERESPTCIEALSAGGRSIGQVRLGPSAAGGYTLEDAAKLRHYAQLIARLVEAAQQSDRWRALAFTDDLTGLANRRRLLEFLAARIAIARETNSTVSALVFDIDDFKRYNDLYGHDAGDQILFDIGQLFVQCSRDTDLVARYGGDEFVVVFWDPKGPRVEGSHPPAEIVAVLHRFRDALRNHTFTRLGPEARGCLTISGGIAHYPHQADTAMALIEAADAALLQAKQAGKNRFWVIGTGDVCPTE